MGGVYSWYRIPAFVQGVDILSNLESSVRTWPQKSSSAPPADCGDTRQSISVIDRAIYLDWRAIKRC